MSSVWDEEPEAIGLVGKVASAAYCPRLRPSSLKPESWERGGGWMWQVGLFVAPGPPDFRRQLVEVIPLDSNPQERFPSTPLTDAAVRSHRSFRWYDRLARNAWWGPPQLRVSVAGVPAFLAIS